MMFLLGLISLTITGILTIIGLVLAFKARKPKPIVVLNNVEIEAEKMKDEKPDIWQKYFGLVDDTDNVTRAVVIGNENTGRIVDYIAPGKKYNWSTHRMEPYTETDRFKNLMLEYFSKRVYGRPFLDSLRPLNIDRVVKKPTTMEKSTLLGLLSAKSVKRYGLYEKGLRPIYLKDIDAGDGIRFNVICWTTFHVLDPDTAFKIYKDSFLPDVSELVSSYISSKVLTATWDQYKVIANSGTVFLLSEINVILAPMGVEITQLKMSDPELNPDMQKAIELKAIAIRTAEAEVAESLGKKDAAINIAEGAAQAIERLALANKAPYEELTKVYMAKGFSDREAASIANNMIAIRENAEAIGKLKAYVAGGNGVGVNLMMPEFN